MTLEHNNQQTSQLSKHSFHFDSKSHLKLQRHYKILLLSIGNMNESSICREMCLWALNNDHPILVTEKHLLKMGCSSNIPPRVQEITQLLTIALSSSKIIQPIYFLISTNLMH